MFFHVQKMLRFDNAAYLLLLLEFMLSGILSNKLHGLEVSLFSEFMITIFHDSVFKLDLVDYNIITFFSTLSLFSSLSLFFVITRFGLKSTFFITTFYVFLLLKVFQLYSWICQIFVYHNL